MAKLQAGFKADVVYACLTDTERLVSAGLIQPIDTTTIAAWDSLFPYFKDSAQIRVGGQGLHGAGVRRYHGLDLQPGRGPRRRLLLQATARGSGARGEGGDRGQPQVRDRHGGAGPRFQGPVRPDRRRPRTGEAVVPRAQDPRSGRSTRTSRTSSICIQSGDIVAGFGYKGYDVGLAKQGAPSRSPRLRRARSRGPADTRSARTPRTWTGRIRSSNGSSTPEAQSVYATKLNQMATNKATLDALPQSVVEEIGMSDPAQLDTSIPTQVPPNYDRWQEVWQQITSAYRRTDPARSRRGRRPRR